MHRRNQASNFVRGMHIGFLKISLNYSIKEGADDQDAQTCGRQGTLERSGQSLPVHRWTRDIPKFVSATRCILWWAKRYVEPFCLDINRNWKRNEDAINAELKGAYSEAIVRFTDAAVEHSAEADPIEASPC